MAEQVTMWRSLDGELHELESLAIREDRLFTFRRQIADFCEKNCHSGMTGLDVKNLIIEHQDELFEMFKEGLGGLNGD